MYTRRFCRRMDFSKFSSTIRRAPKHFGANLNSWSLYLFIYFYYRHLQRLMKNTGHNYKVVVVDAIGFRLNFAARQTTTARLLHRYRARISPRSEIDLVLFFPPSLSPPLPPLRKSPTAEWTCRGELRCSTSQICFTLARVSPELIH